MPDHADLGNPGVITAKNVLPGPLGTYKPVPAYSSISSALDNAPLGAFSTRDDDGVVRQFAGDSGKLYELVGTTWTDRSKSGGYATASGERWEFEKFGNQVIATNFSDSPQVITMGASAFADLTTDFKARHVAVVRDFVVFGNTFDASDDSKGDRIRWSASGDITDYTVSVITGSDYRDLRVGGRNSRILGGERGVIVNERSIFRMDFVGASSGEWFQIDETLPGVGTIAPGAVTQHGDTIYVWSEQGFLEIRGGGTQPVPIGAELVDKWARADVDLNYRERISSVVDPKAGRVYWAYPGTGNTAGLPNKIIAFDLVRRSWSVIEQEVELVWRAAGSPFTLEDLDTISSSIDALDASLDSERWKGGAPSFAAFGSDKKHGFFDGSNMAAEIETKEFEFHEGRRTHFHGFYPLVDGGTATAVVKSRNRQHDAKTSSATLSLNDNGKFRPRKTARYHTVKLNLSGTWTDAVGIQIDAQDARPGPRR